MAATYEPIGVVSLIGAASSIGFTSIPGTYTDLILVGEARATAATYNNNSYLQITVNGDTGTNYSTTSIYSRSTSGSWGAYSQRGSNGLAYSFGPVPTTSHGSGIFGPVRASFMSYANTSVYKTTLCEIGYATNLTNHDGPRRDVGLWRSTAAISSMSIFLTNGDFTAGSWMALYGLAAA